MKVVRFVRYWMPAIVWMAVIFLGSTDMLSAEHTSRFLVPFLRWIDPQISLAALNAIQLGIRKLGHLTEYAILAMLLWRALRGGIRWQMKMSLLLLVAATGPAAEQDYAARFKELHDRKAEAEIEPLLEEWREKKPNDPDAWITSANYYFNQRQVMISTKKPEKGDFVVSDPKTGKTAGSISFEQNKGSVNRAAELLQEATKKFPNRLDIWCGLAFIDQESGNYDAEL